MNNEEKLFIFRSSPKLSLSWRCFLSLLMMHFFCYCRCCCLFFGICRSYVWSLHFIYLQNFSHYSLSRYHVRFITPPPPLPTPSTPSPNIRTPRNTYTHFSFPNSYVPSCLTFPFSVTHAYTFQRMPCTPPLQNAPYEKLARQQNQ